MGLSFSYKATMSSGVGERLMAEFELIDIKTGKRLKIEKDGTELRDEVTPPAIEWCDKGQHYASKLGGTDVYDTLWICLACK
jgi:hypothetical protein